MITIPCPRFIPALTYGTTRDTIAVEDKERTAEDWGREMEMSTSQRVVNLAPAEYSEDSELMRSLLLAVESMCKQIALSQLSVGE